MSMMETEAAVFGIPVQFCDYVDGVRYFRPLNVIIAKNRAVLNEFLEWANLCEGIGNRCVEELELLLRTWRAGAFDATKGRTPNSGAE